MKKYYMMMESVILFFKMQGGKLKSLELMPVELELGMSPSKIGLPRPAEDDSILRRFAEMSLPYGRKFEICGNSAKLVF